MRSIMRQAGISLLTIAASLFVSQGAFAQTYNTSTDWSSTSSTSAVWSYGSETSLGGSLTTYSDINSLDGGDILLWNNPDNVAYDPSVFKNMTNSTVTFGSLTLGAGETAFHPGSSGQYSVYQFTAPSAGKYDVSASFGSRDSGHTEVFVLEGGNTVYNDNLGVDPNASFTNTANLTKGETVDFVVGLAPGTSFNNDTTAVDGTLSRVAPVPEAATSVSFVALFILGGLVLLRNRKGANQAA